MSTTALIETELPLHVHRLELPDSRIGWGHRILRFLRNAGFFVILMLSIVIVGCVMLAKGMTGRKKAGVAEGSQDEICRTASIT